MSDPHPFTPTDRGEAFQPLDGMALDKAAAAWYAQLLRERGWHLVATTHGLDWARIEVHGPAGGRTVETYGELRQALADAPGRGPTPEPEFL